MHTYIWWWAEWYITLQRALESQESKLGDLAYTSCCSTLCLYSIQKSWCFRGSLRVCRAFLVQLAGAASAAGNNTPRDQVLRGSKLSGSIAVESADHDIGVHIYMGGIGFQQAFIFLFVFVTVKFHHELLAQPRNDRIRQALLLLYVVYAALFLITVCIFRDPYLRTDTNQLRFV